MQSLLLFITVVCMMAMAFLQETFPMSVVYWGATILYFGLLCAQPATGT